jgi:GNAT superfamily N-acetyltransferase
MSTDWMPRLRLPLTREQLQQVPRHPAYKYDYYDNAAWLNPRPRFYHAVLELSAERAPAPASFPGMAVQPLKEDDWELLPPVFAAAFAGQQPFASLSEGERLLAARKSLEYTRQGGDGPWIEQASFVAYQDTRATPVGAALVTLLPEGDLCQWDSYYWSEPPPPDCIARRLGRPHLTWIFVTPSQAARGVGTTLLRTVAATLVEMGYPQLASTFLLGNDSSMLWHWRNGFRLLAHPGSARGRGC